MLPLISPGDRENPNVFTSKAKIMSLLHMTYLQRFLSLLRVHHGKLGCSSGYRSAEERERCETASVLEGNRSLFRSLEHRRNEWYFRRDH